MKFFFEFITTPTADTPGTTLIVHFDDKRYLFGHIPEGLQRACGHRNIKFTHVTDIFMSGKTSWANNGGLLGIILTLAESANTSAWSQKEVYRTKAERLAKLAAETADPVQAESYRRRLEHFQERSNKLAVEFERRGKLAIHGGPNLTHTVATARKFIFRTGMPVYIHEFNGFSEGGGEGEGEGVGGERRNVAEPTWTDSHLKVWALSISPTSSLGSPTGSVGSMKSGRKRSLDEFQEGPNAGAAVAGQGLESENASALDKRAQDQIARQAVVSDMFNSDWRLDSLVEMPLSEVRHPAKIFVRNRETHKLEPYTGPGPDATDTVPDITVLVRKPWPGALTETLPPTTPSDISISYIIQHYDVRGKFNAAKAKALGVKQGPKFGQLTAGQSVVSEDGKVITPEMVIGESQPGGGIAFLDIPTADYVENLVNRPEWTTPEVMRGLTTFVWILGPGVGSHPLLQEFVVKMSQYKHIVSSMDYCSNYLAFPFGSTETTHFSVLDNERFHVPHHDNVELPQKTFLTLPSSSPPSRPASDPLKSVFLPALPNLQVELQPKFLINSDGVHKPLNTNNITKQISSRVLKLAREAKEDINSPEFQDLLKKVRQNIPNQDAEIITLGTGSSLPSKYRTVSATLLRVPGVGNYLFDCGENTLGQLQRTFAPEELQEVLRDLKVIWISHLHADHHLGTVSVIRAWHKVTHRTQSRTAPPPEQERDLTKLLNEKRLFVVSNAKMIEWLAEYSSVEDYGFDNLLLLAADPTVPDSFHYSHLGSDGQPLLDYHGKPLTTFVSFNPDRSPLALQLQQATGLSTLLTVPVMHCQGSMATSFVFPSGLKVSYSGDCRPSRDFARVGADSTVLIHEATFEDDMLQDAQAKRHSTCGEALRVAKQMRARNVILTHFSQRYTHKPTIPRLKIWASSHLYSPPRSPSHPRARSASGSPLFNKLPARIAAWRANNPPDVPVSENDAASNGSDNNGDIDGDDDGGNARGLDSEYRTPMYGAPTPDVMQLDGGVPVPVVVAFDMLRVRVGDMLCAQRYVPVLNRYYDAKQVMAVEHEERRDRARALAGKDGGASGLDVGKGKQKQGKKGPKQEGGGKRDGQHGRRQSGSGAADVPWLDQRGHDRQDEAQLSTGGMGG
ncbi:ribonuclease Z [Histoplasma capsulatum G186AR]|uniref:ribonuclease Z n=2 Tax=Ajellomyces capsulatus TaxID=5037 RepID=C0NEF9_AJECG|nr:ribonuclease Z [Histoplasma capsulatum G186AR]EEH09630.1 ribonuclease Z [Histoplasma capsulatum G186AR]